MNRQDKILKHIDIEGFGIEIGPSFSPIAPKKKGFKVHIIDHMNQKALIEKYKNHKVPVENIEEVDFIWSGQPYATLTGKKKYYDWIIASHVIEHTPDLIGFLKDCDAILKDDGIISLVVPNKVFCFDHHRPISSISKIIDNYFDKSKIHSPGTVAEYKLNVVSKSGNIAWHPHTNGEYKFIHTLKDTLSDMRSVLEDDRYIDIHAWCFVPHSLRLIISDLFNLGFIPFQEVDFYPTEGYEFFLTIGRHGKGIDKSRMEMLEMIEAEMIEKVAPLQTTPQRKGSILKRMMEICRRL